MALADLHNLEYWPAFPNDVSVVPNFYGGSLWQINGASDYCAGVFTAPLTGTITKLAFRTGSVTTGCTLDVRLETVDTSTGLPTGTLATTGANVSQVIANTDDNAFFIVDLGAGGSVTRSTHYGIVLDVLSGSPSALTFAAFADHGLFQDPYPIEYASPTATSPSGMSPCMAVYYDGVGWVPIAGFTPASEVWSQAFNSGSTPDTYGMRFALDVPRRVAGLWGWVDLDGDATLKLYDTDAATVLASVSAYQNMPPLTTGFLGHYLFSSSIELAASSNYYLGIEATTGSNITVHGVEFANSDIRRASPFGSSACQLATCTQTPASTGDWTLTATSQIFAGLLIDGLDDGAGGGGSGQGLPQTVQFGSQVP